MTTALLIGIGGFIGSILRYYIGVLLSSQVTSQLPLATLSINLIGSLIIGIFLSAGQDKLGYSFFFLVPGLLGGFTTYSAFSGEIVNLLKQQSHGTALIYISSSVIGGILICWVGFGIGRTLFRP